MHACADLMHHLFPTMELKAGFTDLGIQEGAASGAGEYKRTVIDIDTEMLHHHTQDMAWTQYNLEVKYSGPVILVSKRGDRVEKIRNLHFLNGRLHKIESHEGEMVQKPLKVYIAHRDVVLTPEESFYEVKNGDVLYLEAASGSRVFRSEEYIVARETDVYITNPSRRLIFELTDGAAGTGETVAFRAEALPEGAYRFDWNFGDGSKIVSQSKKAGEASTVNYTYKNLKDGDAFYPSVTLYSADGKHQLAKDSIEITVRAEQSDSLTFNCGWDVPYSELTKKEGTHHLFYEKPSGQKHGPYFFWYVDEDVDQLNYVQCLYEDQKHGAYHMWYKSGARHWEDNYRFNQRHGPQFTWWENGNPKYESNFYEGKLHGTLINWYENGRKSFEGDYNHGDGIGIHKFWYSDGSCQWLYDAANDKYLPCE
jgi:antitoxin component YwqK of YwqJK toxin-antitoxin module